MTNATKREMIKNITAFGRKLSHAACSFFYSSGHGATVNGVNFFIPIRAKSIAQSDVEFEGGAAKRPIVQMERGGGMKIAVFDMDNLAVMDAPRCMIVAFPTSPGANKAVQPGNVSAYAKALSRNLVKPLITAEAVFKRVRNEVRSATGNQQVPWESSSLMGRFAFNPK